MIILWVLHLLASSRVHTCIYLYNTHTQDCCKRNICLPSTITQVTTVNTHALSYILTMQVYSYHRLESPHSSLSPSLSINHIHWYRGMHGTFNQSQWTDIHKSDSYIPDPHGHKHFFDPRTYNKGSELFSICTLLYTCIALL